MTRYFDTWAPWLADLLELGGPILSLILLLALVIWSLLFERIYFLEFVYPKAVQRAMTTWHETTDHSSWFARQWRDDLLATLRGGLRSQFPLIGTLIKLCPLLGLLGTVLGMLEVFDALAATGSNNPRSMAAGVSKATVSTLAGMVVAITGLLGRMIVERNVEAENDRLETYFESTGVNANA